MISHVFLKAVTVLTLNSCRPISLTPAIAEVLETVIDQLHSVLKSQRLLSEHKHGSHFMLQCHWPRTLGHLHSINTISSEISKIFS